LFAFVENAQHVSFSIPSKVLRHRLPSIIDALKFGFANHVINIMDKISKSSEMKHLRQLVPAMKPSHVHDIDLLTYVEETALRVTS
jgi:hypothetical protein